MKIMAEGSTNEQGGIPRAPPPSPEVPHCSSGQFDFSELVLLASKKGLSPTSSREHSRATSPLFYNTTEWSTSPRSNTISPINQSDGYNFTNEMSHLTLSNFEDSLQNSHTHINNNRPSQDVNNLLTHQHVTSSADFTAGLLDSNSGNLIGRRERKISLKRHHDNPDECYHENQAHGIEIKKICHEDEYTNTGPSRRSYTFSGTTSNYDHIVGESMYNQDKGFVVGSLPVDQSNLSRYKPVNEDCVSPVCTKTVGFNTSAMSTDDQMEGVEPEGVNPSSLLPINGAQMDWGNGLALTGNIMPSETNTMNGFSFALPSHSPSHSPSNNHYLNVPTGYTSVPVNTSFLSEQQYYGGGNGIPHITLTSNYFSKSL